MRYLLVVAIVATMVSGCTEDSSKQAPVTVVGDKWRPIELTVPRADTPKIVWRGVPLIHPRGVMLGPDGDVLYVTDPGEPVKDPIRKPSRIVTFSLKNGVPSGPKIFFSRPGFMISAKWGFPMAIGNSRQVLVADQGEGVDEYRFSGKGAKVFTIPVLKDGSAGQPRILWQGKPFVCPTGIANVGETIYVTDPCAGPMRTRPERPKVPFPSSAIFGLRLSGGKPPVVLKSGAPFTSLIGICIVTPGELIVNDTDSGRIEGQSGGRPGFAPPGGADRWVMKIQGKDGLGLSEPKRTRLIEEGPLVLEFRESILEEVARNKQTIGIKTRGSAEIISPNPGARVDADTFLMSPSSPTNEVRLDPQVLRGRLRTALYIRSDILDDRITLDIDVPGHGRGDVGTAKFPIGIADNKHGGAKTCDEDDDSDECSVYIFSSSKAPPKNASYLRFTTDNAPGQGAVYIYKDGGGRFATLAKGKPLDRPVSGQLSQDGKTLWIVDQANGTLFSLAFPSRQTFDALFP